MTLAPGETPVERRRCGMFLRVTPFGAVAQLCERPLVSTREDGAGFGGFAAMNASAGARGAVMAQDRIWIERDAAHGCARFFLDGRLALAASTPMSEGKAGLDGLLEFVVALGFAGVRAAEGQGFVEKRLLNFGEELFDRCRQVGKGRNGLPFLAGAIAPSQHCRLLGHIL